MNLVLFRLVAKVFTPTASNSVTLGPRMGARHHASISEADLTGQDLVIPLIHGEEIMHF